VGLDICLTPAAAAQEMSEQKGYLRQNSDFTAYKFGRVDGVGQREI